MSSEPDDRSTAERPRTWDGGRWRVDRDEIGAYARATNDANPRYTGARPVAPPMYHVRPLIGLLKQMAGDPELAFDRLRLVHGEHAVNFHALLRHDDVLALSSHLVSLVEKPSGRVATFGIRGTVDDRTVLDGTTTLFIRAPVRTDEPKKKEPAAAPPPPDHVFRQEVTPDQAVRYAAASGDDNPIHLDDAVARKGGLPGTILHGLCSMAFAGRDLCDGLCDGDPARLRSLAVRWARPVLPGSTLMMSVWGRGPGPVRFVTTDAEGRPVLIDGRAELA